MPTLNQASIWQTEPVSIIAAAVIAVINGGLQVLAAFGVVVTTSQATSIGVFVGAAIALAALFMRSQVVPVGAPDSPERLTKARLAKAGANGGNAAARSPYREPAHAAVTRAPSWLEHLGGAVVSLATLAAIIVSPAVIAVLIGCTPAEVQWVNGGITIGGQVCQGVVIAAGDPALAPICATAAEVAEAIAQLIEAAKAAPGAMAAAAPPSNAAIYRQVIANRAKKASAK